MLAPEFLVFWTLAISFGYPLSRKQGIIEDSENLPPRFAITMPATFDSFGVQFLYPDNWQVAQREEDESNEGVTMELPGGGFFSIERNREGVLDEELIEEVAETLEEEYEEVEREEVELDEAPADERVVDFRFYYLDLLIVSRLILIDIGGDRYLIQFQAESRDFESNEMVLAAILKQIRG